MSNIRYRRLTDEECEAYDLLPAQYHSYVGIDDDEGIVVAFFQLNFAYSGMDCDSCVGRCARAGRLWVKKEYRRQGIFLGLFEFAKATSELGKIYTGNRGPRFESIASNGKVETPSGPNATLPAGFNPRAVENGIIAMTNQMNLDGVPNA